MHFGGFGRKRVLQQAFRLDGTTGTSDSSSVLSVPEICVSPDSVSMSTLLEVGTGLKWVLSCVVELWHHRWSFRLGKIMGSTRALRASKARYG